MSAKRKRFRGPLGFVLEVVVLVVVSVGLAVLANAAHPQGLPWRAQPVVETPAADVLDVKQAKELLASGRGLFLDARHPADYAAGHIPGALSIPPGMFAEDVQALLDKEGKDKDGKSKVLVAYCSSLQCPLAHRLADALEMIGIEGVQVYEGGMLDWMQNGGVVETSKAKDDGNDQGAKS